MVFSIANGEDDAPNVFADTWKGKEMQNLFKGKLCDALRSYSMSHQYFKQLLRFNAFD